jgi:hypothetical protein
MKQLVQVNIKYFFGSINLIAERTGISNCYVHTVAFALKCTFCVGST